MSLAQSYINPTGEIILHRRKIKPTHVERSLRSRRYISEISIFGTEIGSRDMFREDTAFLPLRRPVLQLNDLPCGGNADSEMCVDGQADPLKSVVDTSVW